MQSPTLDGATLCLGHLVDARDFLFLSVYLTYSFNSGASRYLREIYILGILRISPSR